MLSELCKELKNYFEISKFWGDFEIADGKITCQSFDMPLAEGQYFRIVESIFNDGVWKYSADGIEDLVDESFSGSIWAMAVPREVIELSEQIDAWKNKYASIDSAGMSPFASESFGGYSYTKASSNTGDTLSAADWRNAFGSMLNKWRKI